MIMQAHRRVLGHKVPRLRHLYKPIKSKINQYLNNSQKKINTNYSKNYMILLKLQQITSNNRLERFIYIPSGGDIIKRVNNKDIWFCRVEKLNKMDIKRIEFSPERGLHEFQSMLCRSLNDELFPF